MQGISHCTHEAAILYTPYPTALIRNASKESVKELVWSSLRPFGTGPELSFEMATQARSLRANNHFFFTGLIFSCLLGHYLDSIFLLESFLSPR
jgi:hypothetical protein